MSRTPRIESHRRSPSIALPGVDDSDAPRRHGFRRSSRAPRRNDARRREQRRPALFLWVALAALVLALVIAFDPFGIRERPLPPLVPPTPTKAPLETPTLPAAPGTR